VAAPGAWRRATAAAGADDAEIEALRAQLEEVNAQIKEVIERHREVKQEAKQAEKRHVTDLDNETKYGITKFAKAFLQIPDNLARAAGSVKQEELEGDKDLKHMTDGVAKLQKVVDKALRDFGVVEMKPEGQVFDPQKHEAMFAMEMPGKDPNTIFHVMDPGYDIHDRCLRAAKVGVVKGPA